MDVLIDTTVWSLAMRRRLPDVPLRSTVDALLALNRVGIIGPIRQECLSGAKDSKDFASLRDFLRTLPDISVILDDYELAASFYNMCRSKGIQGSHIDFLILAVANRKGMKIFTADHDFDRYAKFIPVLKFKP